MGGGREVGRPRDQHIASVEKQWLTIWADEAAKLKDANGC
jgi:hypothetical protein